MKSKLQNIKGEVKTILLLEAAVILFLFMVFAWVVAIALTVAKSAWYLLIILGYPLDLFLLKKVVKTMNQKWGVKE